jgi:hypothetical protein
MFIPHPNPTGLAVTPTSVLGYQGQFFKPLKSLSTNIECIQCRNKVHFNTKAIRTYKVFFL